MNDTENAKTHELKTWPDYFDAVLSGGKPFEIRENDRGFLTGDTLHLREYDPDTQQYTGRECHRLVTFMLSADTHTMTEATMGVRRGFVVMGLGRLSVDFNTRLAEVMAAQALSNDSQP